MKRVVKVNEREKAIKKFNKLRNLYFMGIVPQHTAFVTGFNIGWKMALKKIKKGVVSSSK